MYDNIWIINEVKPLATYEWELKKIKDQWCFENLLRRENVVVGYDYFKESFIQLILKKWKLSLETKNNKTKM